MQNSSDALLDKAAPVQSNTIDLPFMQVMHNARQGTPAAQFDLMTKIYATGMRGGKKSRSKHERGADQLQ